MPAQPLLFTLHIQLEPLHIDPPVWRQMQVTGDCTLRKLHHFIQAAFGWHSSHLHEFEIGLNRYLPMDTAYSDMFHEERDDRRFKLRRVLNAGDRLRYLYDFGDSWRHVIAVQTVEPCEITGSWCEVLDGAGACPPENIGGVPGYLELLNSAHEGELNTASGTAHKFNPELFDVRPANAAVQRICNNLWG